MSLADQGSLGAVLGQVQFLRLEVEDGRPPGGRRLLPPHCGVGINHPLAALLAATRFPARIEISCHWWCY